MPRTAKPLTDEQKSSILKLREEGKSIDQISKELHIFNTRVSDFLKESGIVNNRSGRQKVESGDDKLISILKSFAKANMEVNDMVRFTGHDKDTIRRILKENNIKTAKDILQECSTPPDGPQYDLTIRTYIEDEEIVREIKELLGDDAKYVTFHIHEELSIGGQFGYYVSDEWKDKGYYEPETHKFDIIIPEIKRVVIPIHPDELPRWKEKVGYKPSPDGIGTWFNFMLIAVSRYDMIDVEPNNIRRMVASIKEQIGSQRLRSWTSTSQTFQSCSDCEQRVRCNHTGCKVRGIPYTNNEPTDSDDRVTLSIKADMDEASETIREFNGEEYKFWDKKNRIGKGNRKPLTDEELKEVTGYNKDYTLQADIKARLAAVTKMPRRNLDTGGWD